MLFRSNPDSVHAESDSDEDYWFRVSNECLWNRHRRQALGYLDRLTMWQRMIILLKVVLPHFILRYRGQTR